MDTKPHKTKMFLLLAIIAALALFAAGERCAGQHSHPAPRSLPPRVAPPRPVKESTPSIDVKRLAAIQEAVARAIGHLEAGHPQETLKELKQIQGSLESLRRAIDRNVAPSFANDRCPIMGTAINPAQVPAVLTRTYDGRRVAFCCAGCPEAWDRLGNPERTAKLASVMAQPAQGNPPSRP